MTKNEYLNLYQVRMNQLVHDLRSSSAIAVQENILAVMKDDLRYLEKHLDRLKVSNSTPLE